MKVRMAMDSSGLLFAARAYTELIVVLFAICIGWRYAHGRPVLTWWMLWIGVILVLALAVEQMPSQPLSGWLVGAAALLFVVFLPGWLRGGGREEERPRSLSWETEAFIGLVVTDRERDGCRIIQIDLVDNDGNAHIIYRCDKEEARPKE